MLNIFIIWRAKTERSNFYGRWKSHDVCEGIINEKVDRDGKASLRDDGYPGIHKAMGLILLLSGGPTSRRGYLLLVTDHSDDTWHEDRDKC